MRRKLHVNNIDLKAGLDGLDDFADKMISKGLIPEKFQKKKFDDIMKEFRMKIKRSSISVAIGLYNTFIKVLREVGMDYVAHKLEEINWSALHTKKSSRL